MCRVGRKQPGVSLGLSLLFLLSAFSTAFAQQTQPAGVPTCTSTSVTLSNQNPYPIWIGENVSTGSILFPGNTANWELDSGDSKSVCIPADWTSGIFWARTECNFAGTFGQDSNYVDCTSTSQCSQTPNPHVCYGGKCVIDCSTSTGTNGSCSALTNSVCVGAAGSSGGTYTAGSFCGFAGGVCRTGDCGSGLYQCQGTWDGNTADQGPGTPATQFEITDNSAADGGSGAASYDVTNLAGYNIPISVSLDFSPSGPTTDPACYATSCNTDLNTICPSLLQVIEPPTASPTSTVSCGGGYCQSGACETCPSGGGSSCLGGMTCVIGCGAPGKLCGSNYPSPVSAPGVSSLRCDSAISSGSVHGIPFISDGSQYRDMYDAANDSGVVSSSHVGVTMFSGNQGTPTCWGDIDCAPGESCLIGPTNSGIAGLPSYVGICATSNPMGTPIGLPVTDCNSTSDIGNNCGGYPSSPVYSCVAATGVSTGVACLPAFDPPTSGLGTFDSSSGFFDGTGAPLNPEWEAAALWASGNGQDRGKKPYYETFSNACPHQYAWTYDDHTGGLACNGYPLAFTVTFGAFSSSSATPTPSPTATTTASATASPTPTATATHTRTATPTATATATSTPTSTSTTTATSTATATPTSTATSSATSTVTATSSTTPTATATATSTASLTPTATATITATPTLTATPTTAPTLTPSPSSTATPGCVFNVYLTTNPGGTLAFGDVTIKKSVTLPLTVKNNEPVGSLDLTSSIMGGNANDFSVTGGSCRTINRLRPGQTCNYQVRLKPKGKLLGAVNTNLEITGKFRQGVCPAGDVQSVTVNLAGFVNAASP